MVFEKPGRQCNRDLVKGGKAIPGHATERKILLKASAKASHRSGRLEYFQLRTSLAYFKHLGSPDACL